VSAENRELYSDYDPAAMGGPMTPLFRFPPEGQGYTTYQDWIDAWEQIQAA
jgi:hypothetical protein